MALVRSVPAIKISYGTQLDDEDLDGARLSGSTPLASIAAQIQCAAAHWWVARDWSFGYIPLLRRFGQNISEQISRGADVR